MSVGTMQGPPAYKFPEAQAQAEAIMSNLSQSDDEMDAVEERKHARDVARAEGGDSGPQIDPEKSNRIDKAKTSFDVRGF